MKPKSKGPIIEFKTAGQAEVCLREWQSRLFLDYWNIRLEMHTEPIFVDDDEVLGRNEWQLINKTSVIQISQWKPEYATTMLKYCAELTLVHELLHCKIGLVVDNNTHEGAFLVAHEHILLEEMARSLIMAKYGIGRGWFFNG